MRLTRIIIAFMAGFAMVAGPTAAGAAQPITPQPSAPEETQPPYAPAPPVLTVTPNSIVLGESVVLEGSGFAPNATVEIIITVNPIAAAPLDVERARRPDGSTVALAPVAYWRAPAPGSPLEVVTDGDGHFEVTYRPTTVGEYVFTATGSGRTATATVTVLPTQPQPSSPGDSAGGLPRTGDNLGTTLAVGGGLVAFGVVMLMLTVLWRRRRQSGLDITG